LPEELAVQVCFAAATFIPTVSRRPDLRLLLIPPAILFAILCSLNCLFIYAWEHAEAQSIHPPYSTTQFALRHLTQLAVVNIATGAALALFDRHCPWPIFAAIVISTVLLLLLHTLSRHHFPPSLRASADLTLLTPVLLIPFL
jgi:cell division protein FtsW (lipid II flippase)